jgi:hypothetical protein
MIFFYIKINSKTALKSWKIKDKSTCIYTIHVDLAWSIKKNERIKSTYIFLIKNDEALKMVYPLQN